MAWLETAAAASTVLFRVLVYGYLRVLPARSGPFLLPALFLLSSALNVFVQQQSSLAEKETAPPADVKLETNEAEPLLSTAADAAPKTEVDVVVVPAADASATHVPAWQLMLRSSLAIVSGVNIRKPGVNLLGNAVLLLAAVDFTTHPFLYGYDDVVFTRVGAVTHNAAKIQARVPYSNAWLESNSSRVRYRNTEATAAIWRDGPVLTFDEAHDYVAVGKLTGLYPSTNYEYILAHLNGTELPYPATPIPFSTFPDTRLTSSSGTHFKFLVSSCAMPNFPYMPFRGSRVLGFDLLADYLWPHGVVPLATSKSSTDADAPAVPEEPIPLSVPRDTETLPITPSPEDATLPTSVSVDHTTISATATSAFTTSSVGPPVSSPTVPTAFMLFLGDFIYADSPLGITSLSHYRRLYRRMFASSSVRKIYERLPIFTIYDDHEFVNNFAGNSDETKAPWTNASTAYHDYLGSANHDTRRGQSHYEFRYGDNAFFVMDTRKHRSDESVDEADRTMLGEAQLAAFHNWLGRINGTAVWKFVVSSVPFTKLWAYDAQKDSWAAFEKERQSVFAALASVDNVIVLTGDRHQYAAIDFLGGKVLEISTSPMSQFDMAFKGFPALRRWTSEQTFNRSIIARNATDGSEQTTHATTPVEQILHYAPTGNYKVSSIEVDTTDRDAPKLVAELIVNGKATWRLDVVGQPVRLSATQALGRQLSQGFKDILGMMKLNPNAWF